MIRFYCQNCRRKYVLPDALARLPLLCKGCGQRLSVPGPGETAAPPPRRREPQPLTDPDAGSPAGSPDTEGDDLFLTDDDEAWGGDDGEQLPPADEGQSAIPVSDEATAKGEKDRGGADSTPAPARKPEPSPAPLPEGRRALGLAVDIVVGLVLAGVGALLGEFAVRKSTAAILREAGSAPKFPPVDVLVWLACVAFPVLVLVLFANRGKSVGNWLRRRAG